MCGSCEEVMVLAEYKGPVTKGNTGMKGGGQKHSELVRRIKMPPEVGHQVGVSPQKM